MISVGLSGMLAPLATFGLIAYRKIRGFTRISLAVGAGLGIACSVASLSGILPAWIGFPLAITAVFVGTKSYPVLAALLSVVAVAAIAQEFLHNDYAPIYMLATLLAFLYARTSSEQKEQLRKEVLFSQADAAAAEHERTMQDLHDGLGHDLAVLLLNQQLLARAVERGDDARMHEALDESGRLLTEANRRLRAFVHGGESVTLKREMSTAVQELTAEGLTVKVPTSGLPELPPEQDQALGWILREAVTNILKHAHASEVTFSLVTDDRTGTLVISDNGFGARKNDAKAGAGEGRGLDGMRTRAANVGGSASFTTGVRGSTVRVSVPLANAQVTA